jgi:hypothetical protein
VPGLTFGQLLDQISTTEERELLLGIWKVEIEIEHLMGFVRASDLRARDTLEELLTQFAEEAGKTEWVLWDLNSKIAGALDRYVELILLPCTII